MGSGTPVGRVCIKGPSGNRRLGVCRKLVKDEYIYTLVTTLFKTGHATAAGELRPAHIKPYVHASKMDFVEEWKDEYAAREFEIFALAQEEYEREGIDVLYLAGTHHTALPPMLLRELAVKKYVR
ncbi:hypothetical protein HOY82DRAFT_600319 [Tuber indicum]|nr:hypothetical protein HOY82DRAFT_600319 [Tuber indicum]